MMTGSSLLILINSQNNLLPKILLILLLLLSGLLLPGLAYSQFNKLPGDLPDELNQEQWELVRDFYAVEAIKLLARMDTLALQIDSLKTLNASIDAFSCEDELYAMVGATRQQVNDFRLKFDEAERMIQNKSAAPDAARNAFTEINASRIRCLPEFSDRFLSLKKRIDEYGVVNDVQITNTASDSYTVVKGDCLWKISLEKYDTRYLWPAIWEANKDIIPDSYLIYPGQVLKIPAINSEERKLMLERSEEYRRSRTIDK